MQPILLTDKSRLQEVYNLRVVAWERSEHANMINRTIFPQGWMDELDQEAYHWIITNDQNRIIASARIAVIDNFKGIEYLSLIADYHEIQFPCCFYSRMVIHPDYRKLGLSNVLDGVRLKFIKESPFDHTIASAHIQRAAQLVLYGFQVLDNLFLKITEASPKEWGSVLLLKRSQITLPSSESKVRAWHKQMIEHIGK